MEAGHAVLSLNDCVLVSTQFSKAALRGAWPLGNHNWCLEGMAVNDIIAHCLSTAMVEVEGSAGTPHLVDVCLSVGLLHSANRSGGSWVRHPHG